MRKHVQIHDRDPVDLLPREQEELDNFPVVEDLNQVMELQQDQAVALHECFTSQISENNGTKLHVCEFCGRQFTKKKDLQTHVKTHNELLPFPCTECPEKFGTRSKLKIHEKIHTGEAGHTCIQCGRKCVSP